MILFTLSCRDASNASTDKSSSLESPSSSSFNSIVKYLSGKVSLAQNSKFEEVPLSYTIRRRTRLHKRALKAFIKMAKAAKKENINLYVYSGTRNFWVQKSIWEAKFSGRRRVNNQNLAQKIKNRKERALKILEYSSMPGTSRHHWGSDLDISFSKKNQSGMLVNNTYKPEGRGYKVYQWMVKNAFHYGFCQPYRSHPSERNQGYSLGYYEERWHWSYKPLALSNMKIYRKLLHYLRPKGFNGDDVAASLYENFVFNVHQNCL